MTASRPSPFQLIRIKSNGSESCPICGKSDGSDNFSMLVMHCVNDHRFELIHVGQESEFVFGELMQGTVAVLAFPANTMRSNSSANS
jgi:hypothetical protein